MGRNPVEPWLRGTITDAHPVIAQLLYSFEQAREDLGFFTEQLTDAEIWRQPLGLMSVGAHIRHIGGSIDRLLTYAEGGQLSDEQMSALRSENEASGSKQNLLDTFNRQLLMASQRARAFPEGSFGDVRTVGRKALPTTVAGLLVHIAEHTQRHVGQAIVTAKILKAADGQ
jgi:hypothetical protein